MRAGCAGGTLRPMNERLKTALILAVVVIGTGAIAYSHFSAEAKEKAEVTPPSKQLVAALLADDPSAVPAGAEEYVKEVREHFGRVRRARFLEAYTKRSGSGHTATTEVVAEIIVHGKRGAGVLELEFDGPEAVDWVTELDPSTVHSDLTDKEKAAVERGFARRGGVSASM